MSPTIRSFLESRTSVFSRDDEATGTPSQAAPSTPSSIYIIGFVLAPLVLLSTILWLSIRWYRRRVRTTQREKPSGAFLSIRGLVKILNGEGGEIQEKSTDLSQVRKPGVTPAGEFSRANMTSSIVFPDKVITRTPRSPRLSSHRNSLRLSRETTRSPRPSQRSSQQSPSPFRHDSGSSRPRISILRFDSASPNRSSVISSRGSSSSSSISRTVRQQFEPVLPDELRVRNGEHLVILQSFDDGWCSVGREPKRVSVLIPAAFRPKTSDSNSVELGVVPAWIFTKPMRGVYAERPLRSSSLAGASDLLPDGPPREAVVSWSNFA
ncbi:hypothetical protein SERLA73DRAFT_181659 [Serpula lacrymans var. lacrymans S7.3]|uniref:SH3 domain-containing protein n=2 Tax=Serpula lacrymans var. lacrymans TaxID=341189 RepID=F8PYG8_SERL3|nr:uncharacterized protein SERLADRAFT_369772 [Serpula lacrymans var. lacrymans S7.9]EGN98931.1 hypothetical protein SERLA73DRAFT_181659 [Serpula lacrymans var. lacrymans S7.3]EGO24519.1 hypothetical protein SERLADRAFT_369772 [Serpula lacrymans var. lacrymans S7.9]